LLKTLSKGSPLPFEIKESGPVVPHRWAFIFYNIRSYNGKESYKEKFSQNEKNYNTCFTFQYLLVENKLLFSVTGFCYYNFRFLLYVHWTMEQYHLPCCFTYSVNYWICVSISGIYTLQKENYKRIFSGR